MAESLGYAIKRRLLGPPLVTEQLSEERLSKPLALGVLAPDGISSSAYGTEEILIELLRGGLGIAAFALILPLTGVVLFVMVLVVLSTAKSSRSTPGPAARTSSPGKTSGLGSPRSRPWHC